MPLEAGIRAEVEALPGVHRIWTVPPLFFVLRGEQSLFFDAAEMVALAEERSCSLGQIALAYESALLGLSEDGML